MYISGTMGIDPVTNSLVDGDIAVGQISHIQLPHKFDRKVLEKC